MIEFLVFFVGVVALLAAGALLHAAWIERNEEVDPHAGVVLRGDSLAGGGGAAYVTRLGPGVTVTEDDIRFDVEDDGTSSS